MSCLHEELSAADYFVCIISVWWLGRCSHSNPLSGMTRTMNIMITGKAPPTWYEQHRDKWAETGEPIELIRMLRHVTIEK